MTEYLFMTETYPIINQIHATLPCPGRADPLCPGGHPAPAVAPVAGSGASPVGAGCLYQQVENGQREHQGKGSFVCMSARNGCGFPWLLARLGEDNLGVSSEGC